MDTTLFAIFVIATFGLLSVGAIAATVYSFYQQRVYDKTTLPALYPTDSNEQAVVEEDHDDQISEPRFQFDDDDDFTLEDAESNELMKSIEKAAGTEKKPAPKSPFARRQRPTEAPEVTPVTGPPLAPLAPPVSGTPLGLQPPPPRADPIFTTSPFPLVTPNEGESSVNTQ